MKKGQYLNELRRSSAVGTHKDRKRERKRGFGKGGRAAVKAALRRIWH